MAETQGYAFKELKRLCVPLLENSHLSPATISRVLPLLTELHALLKNLRNTGFNFSPSLISYIISLRGLVVALRPSNMGATFMLCGAFVGNMGGKGKGKERDDESKEAAILCLISLTRKRGTESDTRSHENAILSNFVKHARTPGFVPILGQTINVLIITAGSSSLRLQRSVSAMSSVALGLPTSKSWANGEIASLALSVMQTAILKSISDDVCIREGLVREVTDLDDLVAVAGGTAEPGMTPGNEHHVKRSHPWLKATSSQLLIALNTLTPIVSHPTASALLALSSLSSSLLESTSFTLPSCRPLLASFLLSLSRSTYDSVSSHAHNSLIQLTSPVSKAQHPLIQTLLQMTGDILSTLPRVLLSHTDSKVEHLAGQIEAICRLVASEPEHLSALSRGLGKLFGPMGGLEKWGMRLLAVMEFEMPQVTVMDTSVSRLLLERGTDLYEPVFPELSLKHVVTRSAQITLEQMFRGLGKAGGEGCVYAVEWFAQVGRSRRDDRGVAALWLGCRLLEGITGVSANDSEVASVLKRSNRLQKAARDLSRSISELWEEADSDFELAGTSLEDGADDMPGVEYRQGIVILDQSLRIGHGTSTRPPQKSSKLILHSMVSLQLLSVSARVLQTRFTSALLYALYPILQSIVSPVSQLSDSGFTALSIVSSSLSYASPSNLLLSNFDYVLDAISRRLSRQRMDIDAVKVLLIVVRLVDRDVVQKASDVVEECFDRLDEYHGYDIIVDGLIEVLLELVKVIESDEDSHVVREEDTGHDMRMDAFENYEKDTTDYGPAPRRPWGDTDAAHPEDPPPDGSLKQTDPDTSEVTPIQALTIYFLTHESATIRAKILVLLSSAVPVLPESALLTSIHQALSDSHPFVALSTHVGSFMYRRVWDDLENADSESALARRGPGSVGTVLYRSMLKTMTASMKGVQMLELQACATELFVAAGKSNADAVWLVLSSTMAPGHGPTSFLQREAWDINGNSDAILQQL
ncbi:hypothetical protein BC826DRAFT_976903 [Russula brevipes]|nr:hypothetical protein BC826DRAFT_976903 [Russula brevipes]